MSDGALILKYLQAMRAAMAAIRIGMHEINAEHVGTLSRVERDVTALQADLAAQPAARDRASE